MDRWAGGTQGTHVYTASDRPSHNVNQRQESRTREKDGECVSVSIVGKVLPDELRGGGCVTGGRRNKAR